MKLARKIVTTGLLVGMAATAGASAAFAEFPEKPVTITVGFGAGGGVDAISRAASEALSESLGQAIVVKNQPGAGGGLAVTSLKAMPADGYSLAATTSTTLTFDPHANDVGFAVDDFEYIAAFGVFPEALVALPDRKWKTFADAVAEARKSESGLTYASTTSIDRVVIGAIAKKEGVKIVPVPTKGGAEAVAQALGGHVDFAYSSGTYYAQAQAGELHVLAGLGEQPVPGFEEAPTLKSLGYDVSSVNMVLFLAPSKLPQDVRAKLVTAFQAAAVSPKVLELLATRNMGSFVATGDEISALIHAQSDQFADALK